MAHRPHSSSLRPSAPPLLRPYYLFADACLYADTLMRPDGASYHVLVYQREGHRWEFVASVMHHRRLRAAIEDLAKRSLTAPATLPANWRSRFDYADAERVIGILDLLVARFADVGVNHEGHEEHEGGTQ